jgi:hypothetical protein
MSQQETDLVKEICLYGKQIGEAFAKGRGKGSSLPEYE